MIHLWENGSERIGIAYQNSPTNNFIAPITNYFPSPSVALRSFKENEVLMIRQIWRKKPKQKTNKSMATREGIIWS